MKSAKLLIWNDRMLQLMEYSISIGKCEGKGDWCEKIGLVFQNLAAIRSGRQGFTHYHILEAAKLVNADINWIYGQSSKMIRENGKKRTTLSIIKEALHTVEAETRKSANMVP